MKTVYFDNAATTPMLPEVCDEIDRVNREIYANPSGAYASGVKAKGIIKNVRKIVGDSIGARDSEIYFTSGGTESDNLAIKGVMEANASKGKHFITTNIEHHAVLNTAKWLERNGYRVTYIPVDKNGLVNPKDIEAAICHDTILVSVMAVNNEIGSIQPIKEIGAICKAKGVLFHTDAVQAYLKCKINVNDSNIDLLSASAHKINGPKGVGFLYARTGVKINPILHGGEQESGLRSGTENVSGIAGLGKAVEISLQNYTSDIKRECEIRDYLLTNILKIQGVRLNGGLDERIPSNLNFTIDGVEGETLLISLDIKNVAASTGSACAVRATTPSHVLKAIGLTDSEARGSIRLSFSGQNTMEEARYLVDALSSAVSYLRTMKF